MPAVILSQGVIQEMEQDTRMEPIPEKRMDLAERVAVEFTVKDGKIEAVEVTSAEKEDSAYLAMAEDIIPKIIEAQSAEVDTISGATFSSTGIKNAAEQALEQAVE